MSNAMVVGSYMTHFGKFPNKSLRQLAEESARMALKDAGVEPGQIERVFFANAVAGLMSGQEMIRGQVALQGLGLKNAAVINVENACASGSTAFHLAVTSIEAGQSDLVLVIGAEKLTHENKQRSFGAIGSAIDVESRARIREGLGGKYGGNKEDQSLFMDVYASMTEEYMASSGATEHDFGAVAVKNHDHAVHNSRAQYRNPVTMEEVLESRRISGPLTLLMCSPIGDGAAALVLASERYAKKIAPDAVAVKASALVSGLGGNEPPSSVASSQAYEQAGLGPEDLDVVEVHDAVAPAEMILYEEIGLCSPGEAPGLLASGATRLGGRIPVNTSGGLISKGHPIGATGCAQLVEIVEQLRGRADNRQVEGARIGLAENSGGYLGPYHATATVSLLSRD